VRPVRNARRKAVVPFVPSHCTQVIQARQFETLSGCLRKRVVTVSQLTFPTSRRSSLIPRMPPVHFIAEWGLDNVTLRWGQKCIPLRGLPSEWLVIVLDYPGRWPKVQPTSRMSALLQRLQQRLDSKGRGQCFLVGGPCAFVMGPSALSRFGELSNQSSKNDLPAASEGLHSKASSQAELSGYLYLKVRFWCTLAVLLRVATTLGNTSCSGTLGFMVGSLLPSLSRSTLLSTSAEATSAGPGVVAGPNFLQADQSLPLFYCHQGIRTLHMMRLECQTNTRTMPGNRCRPSTSTTPGKKWRMTEMHRNSCTVTMEF
jgi:hypothetical protein